ncbi:hypothetical protein FAIPA1_150038 [Frankia sp. AiPs1]
MDHLGEVVTLVAIGVRIEGRTGTFSAGFRGVGESGGMPRRLRLDTDWAHLYPVCPQACGGPARLFEWSSSHYSFPSEGG